MNNKMLKAAGVKMAFTREQLEEWNRCRNDYSYFIEKYLKIVHVDRGLIDIELYPYQREIVRLFHENRFVAIRASRQCGKSTSYAAYFCWYIIFNDYKKIAILANKEPVAKEILEKIKLAYQYVPKWLQQGVVEWNKTSIELENGSAVMASATSSDAIRGFSANIVVLDEFAFVKPNIADAFMTSVYPTISSGETTKLFIISTTNGLNHFWKIFSEAEKGLNGFKHLTIRWDEVPGRDQNWYNIWYTKMGSVKFAQEFNVDFVGSSYTLIDPQKLSKIPMNVPIVETEYLRVFKKPERNSVYILVVDVARGKELDYSAFTVIDITNLPYEMVARYKDNTISSMLYPNVIEKTAKEYNNCHVLVEVNDAGGEVANILTYELEYENVLMSDPKGKITLFGGHKYTPGLNVNKKTRRIGCDYLKAMVENDSLILNDSDILFELSNFVLLKQKYQAAEGYHDDLTLTLVNFSYLTSQEAFKELTDVNLRNKLFDLKEKSIENELSGRIFVDNGIDSPFDEVIFF
jgi:hypothetical protein